MDHLVLVIGAAACETSAGPLAVGDRQRLPLIEAVQLTQQGRVTLADWREQQAPPLSVSVAQRLTAALETVADVVITRKKRRYRRRDLRADV